MKLAILLVSSASLVCSASTLYIMAQTAKKLDAAGQQVKTDVETFKQKTDRNIKRIRSVIEDLEL